MGNEQSKANANDVTWEKEFSGDDGTGNTLTVRQCSNWPNNDAKKCDSSPTKPNPVVNWIKCGIGSSPGGIVAGQGGRACSALSKDFPCIGGQNCFAVTKNVKTDVKWGDQISGNDGNGSKITFQQCSNWPNNDVQKCFISPTRPSFTHWIACASGSAPNGGACSKISKDVHDFTCLYGRNCFGINSIDVNWDSPITGCDGTGNKLTIQKCNNWVDNNPRSCFDSDSKPSGIVNWINCGIGSSPGGIAPGDKATFCSPLSKDANDFTCVGGQNCFAVTSNTRDTSCENIFQIGSDYISKLKQNAKIVIGIILIFIVLYMLL